MKLVSFRRTIQAVSFGLFVVLFLFTVYPFAGKFPMEIYLWLDPLVAAVSMIGSRALISTMLVGVVLFALTLIFGRFFCGYICPLGTINDASKSLFFKKKSPESNDPKPLRKIKYFILIAVLAASLLGADLLHFLSPLSIVPRSFTLIVFPPLVLLANLLIDIVRPLAPILGLDSLGNFTLPRQYYHTIIPSLLLISVIIIANFWRRRFWCRYVCPTGALLSLVSRFGILKRIVTPKCTSCQRCKGACDMRAIDADPKKTILGECILCGNCSDVCRQDGNRIGISSFGTSGNNAALHVDRRKFILSSALGLLSASVIKSNVFSKRDIKGAYIRPPGSIPESDFLARCIRCGECMKVCKTNGLQPSNLEAGFDALWTPRLMPRIGACEDKCTMCGNVCPTQAIRKLPLEEKLFVKMGTAVIDRHRCIAWEQDKLCLICDEICPYDAIEFRIVDNFTGMFKRPFVLEDKCMGCGWCEHNCPTGGRAAIEVYAIGEERFAKGSYVTEQKIKMREIKDTQESLYDADAIGSGGRDFEKKQSTPSEQPQQQQPSTEEEKLPEGFILE